MIDVSSSLWIELAAAACIGLSGVPGCLWRRSGAAGQPTAIALNLIGSSVGFVGLVLQARSNEVPSLALGALPVGQLSVALDGLSALFLVPILLVSALGSLYGASYWSEREHPGSSRRLRLWWGIIAAAMVGVVLARDAVLFLVAWEVMALAAFFLICTEEERPEVRQASWVYLVATHLGSLCLIGFFSLLAHPTGSFALWPGLRGSGELFPTPRSLGMTGFAKPV